MENTSQTLNPLPYIKPEDDLFQSKHVLKTIWNFHYIYFIYIKE